MKNIHIIPTDKPSRVFTTKDEGLGFDNQMLENTELDCQNQNIYITSDEEIKEGDWTLMFDDLGNLFLCDKPQQYLGIEKGHYLNKGLRKIILTTDQDLIKDGVQVIPEYFLIHYIMGNNPIEYVEIKEHLESIDTMKINYELIIPKEELSTKLHKGELVDESYPKEFKQETLEEAAQRIFSDFGDITRPSAIKRALELAKWQQERMYSEEEVNEIIAEVWNSCEDNEGETFTEVRKRIIEQFKKK